MRNGDSPTLHHRAEKHGSGVGGVGEIEIVEHPAQIACFVDGCRRTVVTIYQVKYAGEFAASEIGLIEARVLSAGLREKVLLKGYRQRRLASLVGSVARGRGCPGGPAKPTFWRTADEPQTTRECPNSAFPCTTPA